MLEEMAEVGDESIVSWQPHGKAFRVHRPEVFARTVMPRYFKHQTKYKSFLRQLHLYDFRRIPGGMDRVAYFHSMFIRNNKAIRLRMTRQRIKGKKSSNAVHHYAGGDPNFYSSATNVDNNQCQDDCNLTNAPRSNPTTLQTLSTAGEKKKGCSKDCPSERFTSIGSINHRYPGEENPPLINSAFLFNQESVTVGPSPSRQLGGSDIGLVNWLNRQGPTIVSREDEEYTSPYDHGYDAYSPTPEKGHAVSLVLCGGDKQKYAGDEGFFAGKRFFHVVEAERMPSITENLFQRSLNKSIAIARNFTITP
jgi:hypothetical protein